MDLLWKGALSLTLLVLAACSGSSQFVVTEHEGCSLDGPGRVQAGVYEFVVSGDASVAVYRLGDETTAEDVEAHMSASPSGATPQGTTRVLQIRNEPGLQGDRSAQNSSSTQFGLRTGSYVFVCDWDAGDRSGRLVVGGVDVTP